MQPIRLAVRAGDALRTGTAALALCSVHERHPARGATPKTPQEDRMALPSGKKEQRDARKAALEAEADRASSLSLPQLAAEVMTKAFRVTEDLRFQDGRYPVFGILVSRFAPDTSHHDEKLYQRFAELVGEGLQVLEHASLVRGPVTTNDGNGYALTRLGRAALERGAVDRIIAGGSL